jgi:hypothetical protein
MAGTSPLKSSRVASLKKQESLDFTANHFRNETKFHQVFNSKISDAMRSGGVLSSIKSTPLGFNLT